ncbi:MAG: carbohydrate kinase family protein, partial [Gemmatimonadota bacterium]
QVVFHHRGANAGVRLEQMPDSLMDRAEVLLATSYPLIPDMPAGGFARALARVDESGGITALDIGPAIGDPVTLDEIAPLLPVTRFLIANTHEMAVITSCDDWERAAERLLDAGARSVVIKRGAVGASLRGSVGDVDVPGFEVQAAASVGAGDAFNAGFLYGVQREFTPQQAARFGNAVAALVVSGERGIMDSPTVPQVEAFLAARADD